MPPVPAVTLHSHVDLDASPVRLNDEEFLLVQRCRVAVNSGISTRFVDTSGECFLRVEADPRMQFTLEYFVRENDGLADYHPGRKLSDRSIAFLAGDDPRHQFAEDGVFIYESANDDDGPGELRGGSCVISYDLHSGLDLTTYPVTSVTPTSYTDIPANAAPTELTSTAKNLLLEDIFYGEENLGASAFTVAAYNGDPAGAGTLLHSITETTPWEGVDGITDAFTYYANPPADLVFNSTGSSRSVSHLRLSRGATVLCDVELDSPVTIPANTTLRVPAANLAITLRYHWGPAVSGGNGPGTQGNADEHPAKHFLGYCLGGNRFSHFPEACFDLQIYETDPSGDPAAQPLDSFRVESTSALWTVSGLTVVPATLLIGANEAPSTDWDYTNIILRLCQTNVWVINHNNSTPYTIASGSKYNSATEPALDIT